MGRLHLEFFDKKSIYECVECEAHFTHTGVLVSKVGKRDGRISTGLRGKHIYLTKCEFERDV